jgi:hypothetical protein
LDSVEDRETNQSYSPSAICFSFASVCLLEVAVLVFALLALVASEGSIQSGGTFGPAPLDESELAFLLRLVVPVVTFPSRVLLTK